MYMQKIKKEGWAMAQMICELKTITLARISYF